MTSDENSWLVIYDQLMSSNYISELTFHLNSFFNIAAMENNSKD